MTIMPDHQTTYRVTFDRIGRHGGQGGSSAPEPIVRSMGGDQLADSIALYARRYIASPSFEVLLDMEAMAGQIVAGFRNAGTFKVEIVTTGGEW
ncbi:hypothetical protein [Streptomyces sp. NPDC002994]|uniref:hypothetical protein n=1 Tax=Streptomyces sp. NPDC002994 TaxID=3154441 RepID=UPI0033AC6907